MEQQKKTAGKKAGSWSLLMGAAFLMATSAIGLGFPHPNRNIHKHTRSKLRFCHLNFYYFRYFRPNQCVAHHRSFWKTRSGNCEYGASRTGVFHRHSRRAWRTSF